MPLAHDEFASGTQSTPATSITSASVTAAANMEYVAMITMRRGETITSVVDSLGELTWSLIKLQCAGSNNISVAVYGAFGSPSGNFTVTANYAVAPTNSVIIVSKVSGATTSAPQTEDPVGENTNGEDDPTCTGGTDNGTEQLTTGSTVASSMHYAGVSTRSSNMTQDGDYSEITDILHGSGGDRVRPQPSYYIKVATGDDQFNGTSTNQDWAAAGMVIKPFVAAGGLPIPVAIADYRRRRV